MEGYIHSLESFGTVDGPGVRYVVFFQGCPMRCQYCHNPDTWKLEDGKQMDTQTIINGLERNRSFYETGGITATGGEPLYQLPFLLELFEKAKKKGIHTCLDTSGIVYHKEDKEQAAQLERLMQVTDLVMLDIKHIDPEKHMELTSQPNDGILAFAKYLDEKNIPVWIRHVVVPGITDDDVYLRKLGYFIGGLNNLKALDVLPYHDMAKPKYKELGIDYKLKDVPPLDASIAVEKKAIILEGIKERRKELKK